MMPFMRASAWALYQYVFPQEMMRGASMKGPPTGVYAEPQLLHGISCSLGTTDYTCIVTQDKCGTGTLEQISTHTVISYRLDEV